MGWKPDAETLENGEISLEIERKAILRKPSKFNVQKGLSAGHVAERTVRRLLHRLTELVTQEVYDSEL